MPRRPLVAVTACFETNAHGMPSHRVGDKYVRAVAVGAGAAPVLVPATGDSLDAAEWVDRFDGFVFTGSLTNVEPRQYGGTASRAGTAHDARRDATTLPLLRALIEADVPILALCRGTQELNVACGGTLHQHVHELPGKLDHRAPSRDLPIAKRYAAEHHSGGNGQDSDRYARCQRIHRVQWQLQLEFCSESGYRQQQRLSPWHQHCHFFKDWIADEV